MPRLNRSELPPNTLLPFLNADSGPFAIAGFLWIAEVRMRGCSKAEDVIHMPGVEGSANILLQQLEPGFVRQMRDVVPVAGKKVVDAQDLIAFGKQRVA